jgi:protein TonB
MFGDVGVRLRSMRSRRSSVVVVSVIAHSAAIGALIIIPLMAADLLPPLPHSMTFVPDRSIVPVLPAAPLNRSGTPHAENREHQAVQAQVPLVAPDSIGPEKNGEGDRTPSPEPPVVGMDWTGSPIGASRLPPAPPQRPAAAPAPVRVHVGVQAPRKLIDVAPVYPPIAQQARVEGTVILEATIDPSGRVIAARVLKSIPLLNEAAIAAVKQWTYTPTLLNGIPVPVIMTVTVTFKLR